MELHQQLEDAASQQALLPDSAMTPSAPPLTKSEAMEQSHKQPSAGKGRSYGRHHDTKEELRKALFLNSTTDPFEEDKNLNSRAVDIEPFKITRMTKQSAMTERKKIKEKPLILVAPQTEDDKRLYEKLVNEMGPIA